MKNKLIKLLNRLSGIEDFSVKQYEAETLFRIRKANWKLKFYPTETLIRLYREFSTIHYFAGWMEDNEKLINKFVKWAINRPKDLVIDLKSYKDKNYPNYSNGTFNWERWREIDQTWTKTHSNKDKL